MAFETASQTAGPYVHIGLLPNACGIAGVYDYDLGGVLVTPDTQGKRITVQGKVIDGTGTPLKDALIEIWQADALGHYGARDPRGTGDPTFAGWGRSGCDPETGLWQFETIKPGGVPAPDGRMMAPHITFWIVARGINIGLHTRLYFPEDADLHQSDPFLSRIEHQNRVPTLIASSLSENISEFNIRLQGAEETVFFDV